MAWTSTPVESAHTGWLRLLTAVTLALLLVPSLGNSPAAGNPRSGCRVQNVDTGQVYSEFRRAVIQAGAGDRLVVKGTCVGRAVIEQDLVVRGVTTRRRGRPTLTVTNRRNVLVIDRGARVILRDLTVRNGNPRLSENSLIIDCQRGGGIDNHGTLILRDVTVRHNKACEGGGLATRYRGTLALKGRTRVARNSSTDSFSGGVFVGPNSTLTMADTSRIIGNAGGGVHNEGTVVMKDASAIRHNSQGGLYNASGGTLVGVSCGPDGNVYGNRPDDCHFE